MFIYFIEVFYFHYLPIYPSVFLFVHLSRSRTPFMFNRMKWKESFTFESCCFDGVDHRCGQSGRGVAGGRQWGDEASVRAEQCKEYLFRRFWRPRFWLFVGAMSDEQPGYVETCDLSGVQPRDAAEIELDHSPLEAACNDAHSALQETVGIEESDGNKNGEVPRDATAEDDTSGHQEAVEIEENTVGDSGEGQIAKHDTATSHPPKEDASFNPVETSGSSNPPESHGALISTIPMTESQKRGTTVEGQSDSYEAATDDSIVSDSNTCMEDVSVEQVESMLLGGLSAVNTTRSFGSIRPIDNICDMEVAEVSRPTSHLRVSGATASQSSRPQVAKQPLVARPCSGKIGYRLKRRTIKKGKTKSAENFAVGKVELDTVDPSSVNGDLCNHVIPENPLSSTTSSGYDGYVWNGKMTKAKRLRREERNFKMSLQKSSLTVQKIDTRAASCDDDTIPATAVQTAPMASSVAVAAKAYHGGKPKPNWSSCFSLVCMLFSAIMTRQWLSPTHEQNQMTPTIDSTLTFMSPGRKYQLTQDEPVLLVKVNVVDNILQCQPDSERTISLFVDEHLFETRGIARSSSSATGIFQWQIPLNHSWSLGAHVLKVEYACDNTVLTNSSDVEILASVPSAPFVRITFPAQRQHVSSNSLEVTWRSSSTSIPQDGYWLMKLDNNDEQKFAQNLSQIMLEKLSQGNHKFCVRLQLHGHRVEDSPEDCVEFEVISHPDHVGGELDLLKSMDSASLQNKLKDMSTSFVRREMIEKILEERFL